MMYFSRLKTGLILGVCLLGALLCIPNLMPAPASWLPWRTVHLGLDLRGGSYLLLEVDMDAVVKERLESLTDGVRQDLRPGNIFYQTLRAEPAANRVLLRLRDPARTAEAVAALQALVSPTGRSGAPDIDIATTSSGGTPDGQITLTLNPVGLTDRASSAVQQSIEIIRRRIDETGVIDPQITRQGSSRIVVQLPGIEDPNRIKELLGKTAHMTFRLVDENANPAAGPPPPGVDFLTMEGQPGQKIGVRKRIDVDGADLTDARAGTSGQTGEWVVNFTFNSVGTRRFADISRANVGHRFAIVLDDKVISAPVIREAITAGRGQISGSFNAASANDLSVLLRAGALPAPMKVEEQRTVGAELGADAVNAGAISAIVGLLATLIFMVLMYGGLFGGISIIGLVVNGLMIIGIMSLTGATLTLPGIAGLILTLAVAVDANVLIYERMRDELRGGRSLIAAMDAGFGRAMGTILDANMTHILSALIMFQFGSGPVRGFAWTLAIGVLTTVFSAVLVTQVLLAWWFRTFRPKTLPIA